MNRHFHKLSRTLISFGLALGIAGVAATASPVRASGGKFDVDDSTIYHKQNGGTNSALQEVPDLFLPARDRAAKRAAAKVKALPRQAQKRVFTVKSKPVKAPNPAPQLFKKQWVPAVSETAVTSTQTGVPTAVWVALLVIAAVALTGLGVVLGHRFSGITREKNA